MAAGLGPRQPRHRRIQSRLKRRRIDFIEHLPGPDIRPLLEQAAQDQPIDLRTDFRDAQGRGTPRQLGRQGQALRLDGHDGNGWRGARGPRRFSLAAGGEQCRKNEDGEGSTIILGHESFLEWDTGT